MAILQAGRKAGGDGSAPWLGIQKKLPASNCRLVPCRGLNRELYSTFPLTSILHLG